MSPMRLPLTLALILASGLAAASETPHAGGGHWSYEGETGPEHWGELSPQYEACGLGHAQSPIDIKPTRVSHLPDLELHYPPKMGEVVNNGHTIQFNAPAGNIAKIGGKLYGLAQFHLHTPSENQFHGISYPLEIHFVHKSVDGKLAVIGVMVAEGDANAELEKIITHAPTEAGEKIALADTAINFRELLPLDHRYYQFAGSLTTPPCSEGVSWQVMVTPISASPGQIEAFRALMHEHNARPVQPVYDRVVLLGQD